MRNLIAILFLGLLFANCGDDFEVQTTDPAEQLIEDKRLIAEYLAAVCGLYLLRDHIKRALEQLNWNRILDRKAFTILMKANSDIFIRTLCLVFSFSYFTAQGAKMGEVILASNAILLHLQILVETTIPSIQLKYKYRLPFYYLNDKPFCYLNVVAKKGYVDACFWSFGRIFGSDIDGSV